MKVDKLTLLYQKIRADLAEALGPWYKKYQGDVKWPLLVAALSEEVTKEMRAMAKVMKTNR